MNLVKTFTKTNTAQTLLRAHSTKKDYENNI